MAPNRAAQYRTVPLIVSPGMDGYRLALAAGITFETVATFPTLDLAHAAYKAAMELSGAQTSNHRELGQ